MVLIPPLGSKRAEFMMKKIKIRSQKMPYTPRKEMKTILHQARAAEMDN